MQDKILENLNEQQRQAVLQKDGAILIIAGAGSGKTRVLTSKIALLLDGGVPADAILALTFTKKAAGEMKSRIQSMVGPVAHRLAIGTFHSVFIQFLRTYYHEAGFPQNFTIYDEDDSASCIKQCIHEILFGPNWNDKEYLKSLTDEQKAERKALLNNYKVKTVQSVISIAKNELITPKLYLASDEIRSKDEFFKRPKLGLIYELYMKRCRKAGAMDFDDILLYMHHILERYPYVRQGLGQRFQYILVDEYQDTNRVQYEIVRMLSEVHGNICAVGDDSQSIYAFRGARIENILHFKNDFPSLKTYRLERNYRSTAAIVDAANKLISHNINRLPKTCFSDKGEGQPVYTILCDDDREEARTIAYYIKEETTRGGHSLSDYAILYRTNAQARALEEAFLKARIPYLVYSGMSFFDRAEVKDVLAYFRLIVNNNDDEAFRRICNKPTRGISDATLSKLSARAGALNVPLFGLAKDEDELKAIGLKKAALSSLAEFTKMIDHLTRGAALQDAVDASRAIAEYTGIYDFYNAEEGDDGLKRSNNIRELLNGVLYFVEEQKGEGRFDRPGEQRELKISLLDYLENIALLSNADTKDEDNTPKVSMMTSHCSKGLEFDTVFITGVEQGLYPLVRENELTLAELEEERRLFYVSMTRAMRRLILTYCRSRFLFGSSVGSLPSQFLDEAGIPHKGAVENETEDDF